jgi:hypothetical protein
LLQEALRREEEKRERERALLLEAQELRRQAVRQERERSAPRSTSGAPTLADDMELPDQLSSRVNLFFTIRSFQDALRDKCKVAVASATTGAAGAP